jgi:hypothetical protein
MLHERLACRARVVAGREPQAHAGASDRHDLVGGAGDRRGVDAEHRDGGGRQQSIRERARPDQLDRVEHARLVAELVFGDLGSFPHEPLQAFDRDVAVVVVQGRDHPRERGDRIGDRSAVGPRMLGARQDANLDHDVGDASDR